MIVLLKHCSLTISIYLLRLCDPVENSIENPLDISNLFEALASNFAGVVQYSKDNRRAESRPMDIDDVTFFQQSIIASNELLNF